MKIREQDKQRQQYTWLIVFGVLPHIPIGLGIPWSFSPSSIRDNNINLPFRIMLRILTIYATRNTGTVYVTGTVAVMLF